MDLILDLLDFLPGMETRFMRQALLGLLLLTPMTAMLGCHVLNFRMAFFSDAVGHSAFAGLALGVILGAPLQTSVLIFAIFVGIAIMAVQRKSGLSADASIGIIFSAVVAFGLAVVSRVPDISRQIQQYLYGDILTITKPELGILAIMLICLLIFEYLGWNRMLSLALSPSLARASGISTAFWQYFFAAILALTVMFCVRAVGVLLVTAMLVVPAAAARNLARNMGGVFWHAIVISMTSGAAGLMLSAQEWLATASGATVILVACLWFAASVPIAALRKK